MFEIRHTMQFRAWLEGLKDRSAVERIARHIVRLQAGLFGDLRPSHGVAETRIDYGAQYRLYFLESARTVSVLSGGSDKGYQARDLMRAEEIAKAPVETAAFDASRYLDTAQAQATLLSDALGSGDAVYVAAALGVVVRAKGMSDISTDAGIPREKLYRALNGEGDPKLSTLLGVMKALNFQLHAEHR